MPHRLYADLSWLWPIISPPEHYVQESHDFAAVLKQYGPPGMRTLLHLGCGGGHNDFTLKEHFNVTGVDISEGMLTLARRLNPEATYVRGDMRSVRLGETFSAVAAFDAINYIRTEEDLRAVFATAHAHLEPGGVFMTYVEEYKERGLQARTAADEESKGEVEVVFIENYADTDPDDSEYEAVFVYLVRQQGVLSIETDVASMGIFPLETWIRLLLETGFDVKHLEYPSDIGPLPVVVGIKTRP